MFERHNVHVGGRTPDVNFMMYFEMIIISSDLGTHGSMLKSSQFQIHMCVIIFVFSHN